MTYLNSRNISVGFLVEIDQFLHAHPEITSCSQGLAMLQTMNASSPLEAYRHFIRGYTRPARYKNDIVSTNFNLPVGFRPPSVSKRHDPEMDDFFNGFEYRWDILESIDRAVADACAALGAGQFVNASMRRLICYAVWGNPVDAYSTYFHRLCYPTRRGTTSPLTKHIRGGLGLALPMLNPRMLCSWCAICIPVLGNYFFHPHPPSQARDD